MCAFGSANGFLSGGGVCPPPRHLRLDAHTEPAFATAPASWCGTPCPFINGRRRGELAGVGLAAGEGGGEVAGQRGGGALAAANGRGEDASAIEPCRLRLPWHGALQRLAVGAGSCSRHSSVRARSGPWSRRAANLHRHGTPEPPPTGPLEPPVASLRAPGLLELSSCGADAKTTPPRLSNQCEFLHEPLEARSCIHIVRSGHRSHLRSAHVAELRAPHMEINAGVVAWGIRMGGPEWTCVRLG